MPQPATARRPAPDPASHPAARAFLADAAHAHALDGPQAAAVWDATCRKARPKSTAPDQDGWAALARDRADLGGPHAVALAAAAGLAVPDRRVFAVLSELHERCRKAAAALDRQITFAGAMQGVDRSTARTAFDRFRAQPDPAARPPEVWVRGFTGRDTMAVSCPADPATLGALWRMQADPDAFAGHPRTGYASVDLETAGPQDKTGFLPWNGSIIEAAVVLYDHDGTRTGTVGGLIQADPAVLAAHGTGSVHIHGIQPADLVGKPTWTQAGPALSRALQNRTWLVQNAHFERTWLTHHMGLVGAPYRRDTPTVDTLCLAQQHAPDLPDYRLGTTAPHFGVSYDAGHRAEHDAAAAAGLFFAVRASLHAAWAARP